MCFYSIIAFKVKGKFYINIMCLTSVIHKDNVFQILVVLSHVIITNLAIDSM